MKRLTPFLITFSGLTGLLLFGGCGNSKSETPAARQTESASTPAPPPKAASNKIAIPFDIAIQAALNGHTDTVLQALETGTDPNQTDEDGRTLLMVCAFNAHTDIAAKLIEKGAKLDTADLSGRTALMYAATGSDLSIVSLLLENKAQVNLVDKEEHWSALMFAASEGNQEIVELLLQHGADNSLVDIDGESAELFARNNGHPEVADYLKTQPVTSVSAP